MKCLKCGKEIAEDSMFCEYCGTKIESAASASSEKNIHSKSKTPLWITLAILLFAIIAGIVVYYQHNAYQAALAEANQRAEAAEKELERAKYIAQGYIDLGLPSGTLWKDKNEEGGFYSYEQAIEKFGNNLPSSEQWEELMTSCHWSWIINRYNGYDGYKVVGPNGDSIFLPAAGLLDCDGGEDTVGFRGYYWGYTLGGGPEFAYYLYFYSGGVDTGCNYGCYGRSVRLVYK